MKKSPNAVRNSKAGGTPKMKQASLMSFFKPAKSSPVKEEPDVLKTPVNRLLKSIGVNDMNKSSPKEGYESDKENDRSMVEKSTDTPLTSELDNATTKPSFPQLSPLIENKNDEAKENAPENAQENAQDSSPLHRRAARKPVSYVESDEEEEVRPKSKRRRRMVESDDDEDFAFNAEADGGDDDDDDMSDFVVADGDLVASEPDVEEDDDEIIPKKPKKSKPTKPALTYQESKSSSSLGNKFRAGSSYSGSSSGTELKESKPRSPLLAKPKSNFAKENEERYQWLVDIKDADKRAPSDPEYDPRTLYIPQSAWSKFTPFEKQYWEVKSTMWDTVVFFKKGKFYELYENDATIANTEFDLKIAGGGRANMKLAGIPEMSFEYWAKEFISHGYKVAKVDQKETLLAKEMRGGSTKEEKIIKRELAGILTGGTLTDLSMINDDMAIYCMSIKEETLDEQRKSFGVAFVDTATSELNMIQFEDDNECTKLETLVAQIKPREILCEKGNLSTIPVRVIRQRAQGTNQIWNNLNPGSEFWDYETTIENTVKGNYYEAENLDDYSKYPKLLLDFKDNHKLAFNAFGGLLWYLKTLMLDQQIMTLANFNHYEISKKSSNHLLLDGITLNNLEILSNNLDGGQKGTLLKLLNRAITSFGKRALKNWVLHPLMNVHEINERYDAVEFFINGGLDFRNVLEDALSGLPDLERLLARIHSGALKFKDFLKVIESFEKISNTVRRIQGYSTEGSGALHRYLQSFPSDFQQIIADWEDAFDRNDALHGIVSPSKGVDLEFDESKEKIDSLEAELNEHLRQYKKEFKSNEICYKDSGKEIYLIEIPNRLVKNIPQEWQQMGSTSKVKRYWSEEVRLLVRKLLEQKETHKLVSDTLKSRMYARFDQHYSLWRQIIKIIGNIDCLIALTRTSEVIGEPSCRPEFVESDKGVLDFKELRHPCYTGANDFIPNDVQLGGEKAAFGLLTGANAAGKSTLMRTTALAVILCQIGCFVPASQARLTPVDKIMTRLGANDNILQGKSTFFVELSETKKILRNATPNSLVILDELGRGGSSSDGYAIAESVLYQLATHVQSMGFFATHYGTLGLSFQNHPQIRPLRMGIIVDNHSRNITFLYLLEEGSASGSFGMNVASMCGISNDIVDKAEFAAKKYELTSKLKEASERSHGEKLSLGLQSDFAWIANDKLNDLANEILIYNEQSKQSALKNIFQMIEGL